jgi:hypothetical protein
VFGRADEEASPFEPLRVFEAAHRALRVVEPALVLVDDLQWLDELSLALCHYLVRAAEASRQPLALIAVARPSPNATSFIGSLAQVLPAERMRQLELGPLAGEEALELAKALAPTAGEDAARVLAEKSGGSPFWLEALVRGGGAEVDAGRLVTGRLRGAGADAAALLALLAIAAPGGARRCGRSQRMGGGTGRAGGAGAPGTGHRRRIGGHAPAGARSDSCRSGP